MKAEKLELMDKWLTVSTLMGLDYDDIYDDWEGQDFYSALQEHEEHVRRLADPDENMKIVLQTVAMGITSDDIDEYVEHRNQEEERKRVEEMYARINANPSIVNLRENHNFVFSSGRYKNHEYFNFIDSNGKEMQGRIFRQSWHNYRIWLTWKDSKGKKVAWRWDSGYNAVTVPKSFPHEWQQYGYTSELKQMAYVVAHNVVNKSMPKSAKFTYPK
jgi:hypothetical protein